MLRAGAVAITPIGTAVTSKARDPPFTSKKLPKSSPTWGAAIAQWIRLRLPSCHPGFGSQAHHLCFHQFKFEFNL